MFEFITLLMIFGAIGLGALALFSGLALVVHLVVGLLGAIFWVVCLPIRAALWLLVLPLKILGGLLSLLLSVLVLPFLLIGALGVCGVAGAFALAHGLVLVALPLLLLVLPIALVVWLLRRRPASGATS